MPPKKKGWKVEKKVEKKPEKKRKKSDAPSSSSASTVVPVADRRCSICEVTLGSVEQYQEHVNGKKHAKQVEAVAAAEAEGPVLPDISSISPAFRGFAKKSTKSLDDSSKMKFETRWMELRGSYLTYALDDTTALKGVIHLAGTSIERSFHLPTCYEGCTLPDEMSEGVSVPPTPLMMTPIGMTPMGMTPLHDGVSPFYNGINGHSPPGAIPDFHLGESHQDRMLALSFSKDGVAVSPNERAHQREMSMGSRAGTMVVHAPECTLRISGGDLTRDLFLVLENEDILCDWRSLLLAIVKRTDDEEREEEEDIIDHIDCDDEPTTDPNTANATYRKTNLKDFVLLTTIGRGSFGKVMKVKRRSTGAIYAMKVLTKEAVLKDNIVDKIHGERNSLAGVSHPFLAALHWAFQTPDRLYFVMEYYQGGDLRFHLRASTKFPQPTVQFYSAQLVLALEHLHQNHILYRDLKPANVVLGADGYAVLTDFGMAKRVKKRRANSFCGTDTYMAPEVIAEEEYSENVDFWSLGICIYEMLSGNPPFNSNDAVELYEMIQEKEIPFPECLSESADQILRALLTKDAKTRLGKPRKIKSQPFYEGMDWAQLLAKTLPPPFLPNLEKSDTRYFEARYTNERPKITKCLAGTEVQQEGFVGFSYPRLSCS